MKLLKGTIAAFAVTALLSSVGVNAESIWHFAGVTLEGHGKVNESSVHEKDIESLKFAVEAGKATAREKGHAVMIGHAVTSELADLMMHYYPSLIEEGFIIENLTYLLNEARKNDESAGN